MSRRSPRSAGRVHAARAGAAALAASTLVVLGLAGPVNAKVLVGTAAGDRIHGHSAGGDLIYGGGGRDVLVGGRGDDELYGVRSNNTIRGGRGDNYIEGGTGNDRISAKNGDNTVYGGTGSDHIHLGDGDNYVDPGAATDSVELGNGNNVVNGGSGGMVLRAGGGDNTVYSRSGPDDIRLGSGVNRVYLASVGQFAHVDCGGNAASVLFVSRALDPTLAIVLSARTEGKVVGCPTITLFDGPPLPASVVAEKWKAFDLVGGDGPDQLYGGHGGGTISAGGGNNVIWADRSPKDGGAYAWVRRTVITAGDGDNEIFGGRGTNEITAGSGRNFVRGGDHHNLITLGAGDNVVRLGGTGVNKLYLNGGRAYIESFARGSAAPVIWCRHGVRATIVYGVRAPQTHHCGTAVKAASAKGKQLLVRGLEHVRDSDAVVFNPILPGAPGVGVPRPIAAP